MVEITPEILAEAMRASGGQVFEGGGAVPAAFYLPWAREILATLPSPVAREHPHDGYAYDGCVCVCCLNVRALAAPASPAGVSGEVEKAAPCDRRSCVYQKGHATDHSDAGDWPCVACGRSKDRCEGMLHDYAPASPAGVSGRVQRIRDQQASGGGPVTAVMVSRSDEAPAPTPSEPVERCGSEHDWETRHPGDLAVCRRCWTVESDTTPATRDE